MIFSRYFKSGAKALDSEAEAWVRRIQSGQATRRDALALREWCAHSDAHAAAFERARRAWVDIGQAGRAFRAAHPRAAAAALARPRRVLLRAGLAGAGAAAAAAALPPLGWWASLEGLGADYSTAVGEQRTVDWDGGQAVVELDARTRMNVADGPRRLELLEGQAAITCAEQGQGLTVAGAGEILLDAASVAAPQRRRGHGHLPAGPRGYPPSLARTGAGSRPAGALRRRRGDGAGARRPGAGHGLARGRAGVPRHAAGRGGGRDQPLPARRIMVLDDALAARRVSGRFQIARLDLAIDRIREAFGAHVRQLPKGIVLLS
ncbi:DUF4880 domain-containing protein [Achromobacter xylosoxidans]